MPACTCCTLHWLNWIISSMPCPSVQHLSDNLTMKGWMADMRPRQTAVTAPKWQHQNSPGPIVRGAREPHLIKNLNYRIGMRRPRFWKHHAMGLMQVHTFPLFGIVTELLTCLSRRYPGIDILLKIFSAICACWTLDEDYYGLKDAKGCILEFLAGEINLIGLLGVDKTSIRKSVSWALVRRLFRFSAGGLTGVLGIEEHMLVHCLAKC